MRTRCAVRHELEILKIALGWKQNDAGGFELPFEPGFPEALPRAGMHGKHDRDSFRYLNEKIADAL